MEDHWERRSEETFREGVWLSEPVCCMASPELRQEGQFHRAGRQVTFKLANSEVAARWNFENCPVNLTPGVKSPLVSCCSEIIDYFN